MVGAAAASNASGLVAAGGAAASAALGLAGPSAKRKVSTIIKLRLTKNIWIFNRMVFVPEVVNSDSMMTWSAVMRRWR